MPAGAPLSAAPDRAASDGAAAGRAGSGAAAPPSVAGLTFVNWQEPIGCGGVAIYPDDLIVADNDGAVIVPQAMVDEVLPLAQEQENLEAWILNEVKSGAKLPGLYPANEENKRRYEAHKAGQVT